MALSLALTSNPRDKNCQQRVKRKTILSLGAKHKHQRLKLKNKNSVLAVNRVPVGYSMRGAEKISPDTNTNCATNRPWPLAALQLRQK
jgi:hypothetical protein